MHRLRWWLALSLLACSEADETGQGPGTSPGETGPSGAVFEPSDCEVDLDCQPEAPNTGDYAADCVERVNQFRACACVPPLQRKRDAEDCLDQQAAYDVDEGPHAGFIANVCEPRGVAQNECPGWPSVDSVVAGCLQSMFDEGPPPSEECEGDCYLQHGHFINMTNHFFMIFDLVMYDVE
jgi:hypothetical protein